MSTSIHSLQTGTFLSDGLARSISLPPGYDYFELVNITDIGDAGATTQVMRAKGYSSLPAGSAYLNLKTNAQATLAIESMITTAGFTFVADSGIQTPGAAVAVTAITAASPAVISSASTAVVGDVVRVYSTTNMLQVAGWDFSVSAVNPGVTQSIANLPAAGFLAAATAGFIRIIPFNPRFYPARRRITAITAAATTIIALNVTHGFTVGQLVRVIMPAGWGMPQINGLTGTITAIGAAIGGCTNTISLNIDSSAFTAFAFPTSAIAAIGTGVPEIVPVGAAATVPYGNVTADATQNISGTGVIVGTGVQTTGKVYQWLARRGQNS
jgi:hypothetical protein